MNGGGLHHDAESLIVVHTGVLGEPSEDPTSPTPIQRTICLELVLKIHLSATKLAPKSCGTKSKVLLRSRASYNMLKQIIVLSTCT
jgi:hypothetical protein